MERQPLLKDNVQNRKVRSIEDTEHERASFGHEKYDPHSHRKLEHPTSNLDTMIHLLKGNVGTGILAMPYAFKNAGLYLGLFGIMLMGIISTHCMHILLGCTHELCRRQRVDSMDYSEVCYNAFATAHPKYWRFSPYAKFIINGFLFLSQLGFCCVYILFVAKNLQDVVTHYYGEIDVRIYLLALLLPMILLNFLKNLKYLTPVSFLASFLTMTSLVIIFYYILRDVPSTKYVEKVASWNTLPLFFGTVIFAFEGIGMVLPLENNMESPQDFGGLTGVMNTSMEIVATLYAAIGFYGYLKYGDKVNGSITLNLDQSSILAQSVRVMLSVSIFLSYGLQFYIPMQIIGPWCHTFFSDNHRGLSDGILRISLIIITFILAAIVPQLGAIISLFGSIFSSSLGLIFPPIIEIITFGMSGMGEFYWKLWKNVAILVFGMIGFVFGAYVSILELMKPDSE